MQIALAHPIQGMRRAGGSLERAATAIAAPQPGAARGTDPSPAPPSCDQGLTAAQASGEAQRAMADMIRARRAYDTWRRMFQPTARRAERAEARRGRCREAKGRGCGPPRA